MTTARTLPATELQLERGGVVLAMTKRVRRGELEPDRGEQYFGR